MTIPTTGLARGLLIPMLLATGLSACDDKQAQNNTPTKPSGTLSEPQTDQSAPATQRPKQ